MNIKNKEIKCADYKKNSDIHGTVLYPGVMVAPVQSRLLKEIMGVRNNLSLFDPFHGSGTSLYEAAYINETTKLIGFDINPLANLITSVKLDGVDFVSINQDIQFLMTYLSIGEYERVHFDKIEKWFREDIIISLSKIRSSIMKISNRTNRRYFWVILCDLIRKYSNTRSSTYKLHIKEKEKIECIQNNIVKDFLEKIVDLNTFYDKKFTNKDIRLCDTLKEIKTMEDNSIDIVVTSPPYGDNATTVPYGQFSYLALRFIDYKDLIFDGWEFNNASAIDSRSIGGNVNKNELSDDNEKYILWYLNRICKVKQKKVKRFFADYFVFLDEISRVCKGHIIITLGNRTVDKQKINLTQITKKYLVDKNFIVEKELKRNIGSKRIPSKTSLVNGENVFSMTKEFVLVLNKTKSI